MRKEITVSVVKSYEILGASVKDENIIFRCYASGDERMFEITAEDLGCKSCFTVDLNEAIDELENGEIFRLWLASK